MIDLKKEIKKLKCIGLFNDDFGLGYNMGNNKVIEELLELLDQYNIITAPKTIKLSEIVNRLKERIEKYPQDDYMKVLIERDETKRFITLHYEGNLHGTKFKKHIVSFWNNDKIGMPENTNFKWLYALWITGTIIEDDLKEDE